MPFELHSFIILWVFVGLVRVACADTTIFEMVEIMSDSDWIARVILYVLLVVVWFVPQLWVMWAVAAILDKLHDDPL